MLSRIMRSGPSRCAGDLWHEACNQSSRSESQDRANPGVLEERESMSRGKLGTILFVAALSVETSWAVKEGGVSSLERKMVELVNIDRARHRLPPLQLSPSLAAVSRQHSREMADRGFFSHRSPTTGQPQDRLDRAGIGWSSCAENIALDVSVEDAQAALMRSPGHRANILSGKYSHIGIGIVETGGQIFVTQNFIRPGGGGSGRSRRGGRSRALSLLSGLFR